MRANEFLKEDEPVKIKLGNNDAAKAWIEKVYTKYPHTMQNNHVMVWGEGDDQQFAMFELTPSFSKRGAVEVKWIQAYPLRQGVGSRAMQELQSLAREDSISLTLFPWDKGRVSQAKLMKFYKGQGFKPTVKGGKNMSWGPELDEAELETSVSGTRWNGSALYRHLVELDAGITESSKKSQATRRIQNMLNAKYDANLDVDGILGPLTIKSINKFVPNARARLADQPNKTTAVQGKKNKEQGMAEGELEEDRKSALATVAMVGAMAMGANAKVPELVRQAVEPGDTVYSIARQNNVNPVEIFKLNKMDRNTKLEIGQKVLVPDYSKPAVAPTVKSQSTKVAQSATSKSLPKQDSEVTLLSMNSEAEAALQTAAKAAGLKGVELAQFMAQTRHESWDFSKMKEVGNKQRFAKYDQPKLAKQLGNKVKGDGERFKGRGFIQLTGRDNYTRASKQIFGDDRLVKNPELASRLDVGAQIALWFWKNQVRPNVNNFNNTIEVVKAINAGEPMHVVQQRHNKFKEYLAVL
jgi:putative chitinase